jgi:hypothetical protein
MKTKNKVTKPYHVSNQAVYFRNTNGLVYAVYRNRNCPACVAHVSNDAAGRNFINTVLKPHIKLEPNQRFYFLYRCPKDGKPYSPKTSWIRRGNITKNRAKVIYVGIKNK